MLLCYKYKKKTKVSFNVDNLQKNKSDHELLNVQSIPDKVHITEVTETDTSKDLCNTVDKQSLSTDSEANPSNISIHDYDDVPVESGKSSDNEASPTERLKLSISKVSLLLGSHSATGSVVHIADDVTITSPSLTTLTTYKSDFTSDTSNDTTRSSSAATTTTTSSSDGEVCVVLRNCVIAEYSIGTAIAEIIPC